MNAAKLMGAMAAVAEAEKLMAAAAKVILDEATPETEPETELEMDGTRGARAVKAITELSLSAVAYPNQKKPGQMTIAVSTGQIGEAFNGDLDAAAAKIGEVLDGLNLQPVGDKVFAHVGGTRAFINLQAQDFEAPAEVDGANMAGIFRARLMAGAARRMAEGAKAIGALRTEISVRI